MSYVSAESEEKVILFINDGEPSDILKGINIGNYPQGAQSTVNSKNSIIEDFSNILIYNR